MYEKFKCFQVVVLVLSYYLSCIVSWSVSNEQNCGPTFVGDVD